MFVVWLILVRYWYTNITTIELFKDKPASLLIPKYWVNDPPRDDDGNGPSTSTTARERNDPLFWAQKSRRLGFDGVNRGCLFINFHANKLWFVHRGESLCTVIVRDGYRGAKKGVSGIILKTQYFNRYQHIKNRNNGNLLANFLSIF